jgi:ubiquinone/menaquinone biosynthesis C-methylase UbiE
MFGMKKNIKGKILSILMKNKIKDNEKKHNKIYKKYEKKHIEIFNDIEQERLFNLLKKIKMSQKKSKNLLAVDLGCGSGNLTNHLLNIGYKVLAIDISENFLKFIKKRFQKNKNLSVKKINGIDLNIIKSRTFDFIAVYSVLHHVPDYLKMVEEMCRVLKHGGILLIDHEANEDFWNKNDEFKKFSKKAVKLTFKEFIKKYFNPINYIIFFKFKFLKILDPKYEPEGDIHVYKDDHIEWSKIKKILNKKKVKIIEEEKYLLYRKNYDLHIYNDFKDKVSDMKYLVGKKI